MCVPWPQAASVCGLLACTTASRKIPSGLEAKEWAQLCQLLSWGVSNQCFQVWGFQDHGTRFPSLRLEGLKDVAFWWPHIVL